MPIKVITPTSIKFSNSYASADLILWPDGKATIGNLYSRRRGQGHARDIMEHIMIFCDDNDIQLGLRPESYGPGASDKKTASLREFYKKFGFKHVGKGWLVRKPKKTG